MATNPNYAFIFEQLDAAGTTDRIRERQRAGDLAGMAEQVPDQLLDHFVVTAPMTRLADAIMARYEGVATRVVHYFAGLDWTQDPTALGRWADVARELTTT